MKITNSNAYEANGKSYITKGHNPSTCGDLIPPNPHQYCPFITTRSIIECIDLTLLTQPHEGSASGPIDSFMYALKSSESRRQYPRRLKLFFDFEGLRGTLNEQAMEFLMRLSSDINSEQDNLLRFLEFHKERVRRKELAAGTVKNYYRAVKLFCEMNDVSLNWKKISRGLLKKKSPLTGSTLGRRAQTIISWFKWIRNNLGIVEVNDNGEIRISRQTKLL